MDYRLIGNILLIIAALVLIFTVRKQDKTIDELKNAKKDEIKEIFKEEWNEEEKTYMQKRASQEMALQKLDTQIAEREPRYKELHQDLKEYERSQMEAIGALARSERERQEELTRRAVENYENLALEKLQEEFERCEIKREEINNELNDLWKFLEEERAKKAALNEEIRKQEEKEKYNEIHSVSLTENEKEDIHFLLSLEDRLHNKQALYKLVWSVYLQQAYKNTFHRILGNRDPKNVIYCIENIHSGKKYIGKTSAEVSKRWTEHIKTSLNIGGIKTTNIHKALYNHWDEFIFYIITEAEKDKLSELEKYYIGFYESDKYGYNIKAGG